MLTEHWHVLCAKCISGIEIMEVLVLLFLPRWCTLAVGTLSVVAQCREQIELRMVSRDLISLLVNVSGESGRDF